MTAAPIDSVSRPPRKRGPWINIAVIMAATAVGLVGYAADFANHTYLLAATGGLLIGGGVAWVAARYRLSPLLTAVAGISAFFVLGTPFTMPGLGLLGVLPTPRTFAGLARGAVDGWADIVTLSEPIEAPYYLSVVPFLTAWLAALIGCSLAFRWLQTRTRTPFRSLVTLSPAITVYVATVLLGTHQPYLPIVRGVLLAGLALVWISWRQPSSDVASTRSMRALVRQRLIGTAIVAGGAIMVAATAGGLLMPPQDERFVLRDEVAPPFEPHDFPSPLAGFRHYTKDLNEDVVFTVTGLQEGDTIRLAVMDTYDGRLWDVTSGGLFSDASGTYELVGSTLPEDTVPVDDATRTVSVSVDDYSDIWLPIVGQPSAIAFADGIDINATALRYNPWTRTGVVTTGLTSGMSYDLTVSDVPAPTDEQLAGLTVAQVNQPPISNVPSIVSSKAQEFEGEADTPLAALRSIEKTLHDTGFLSHGTSSGSSTVPSLAGHGADRLTSMFEKSTLVGDAEQYAAAFALMARELGYPARVVMGFAPEIPENGGPVTVTGDDVTAWVEVPFEGVGWVAFFPTPDNMDVPRDEEPLPRAEPQPQVRQPPRTDELQDEVASPVQIDQKDEEDPPVDPAGVPGWVWALLIALAVPVVLYGFPAIIVGVAKSRRRSRRRSKGADHQRAAGAWDEVEDAYAELGYSVAETGTRIDKALDFEDQFHIEIAARVGELEANRRRAAERTEAKVAKLEASQHDADVKNPLLAFREATVLRAKQVSVWHPGVAGTESSLPVLVGLRDLAVDTDRAVFSGEPTSEEQLDAVWRTSDEAVAAARKSVGWVRRELSRLRFRFRRTRPGVTGSPTVAAAPTPTSPEVSTPESEVLTR